MRNVLFWGQIAVSLLLTVAILLQQKGTGLGSTFGGSGQMYRSKRGIEKTLFVATIVLGALFVIGAFVSLIIK